MKKAIWLNGIALMMLFPFSYLIAQDDPLGHAIMPVDEPVLNQPAPSEYWLGIECHPVLPAMRAQLHLSEEQGIVVESVVPDSPAAKAGLVKYDIILKANDKTLSDVSGLIESVDAVKDKEMKLEIIRDGKSKTIAITPSKRPEGLSGAMPFGGNVEAMQKMIEEMHKRVQSGQMAPMRFWSFRPGVILPPGGLVHSPLPGSMSISITKTGDKPADIVVKMDNEKWEVTEKDLDKLPEKVRPHVDRMLGLASGPEADATRWMPQIITPPSVPQQPGTPPAPDSRFRVFQGQAPNLPSLDKIEKRIEKRMEEMKQRMEKMEKQMQERFGGEKTPPQSQPAEKNPEPTPEGKTL